MAERILIAEHDDGLRETLASRLRHSGAYVQEASDTESAADILSRIEIDVAVIGLAGFGSAGLQLLKVCRLIQPPTEVILLVGKHQGSLAITGMKLGAFRDAQLPIHVESFREIIHEACQARRKRLGKKAKRRFLDAWPDIFAAATFAQHGEFETARQLADREQKYTERDFPVRATKIAREGVKDMKEFKILLVDDEEDFVKTLAERLTLKQVAPNQPGVALSGEDALQSLESDVPDVMVLDLRMPGIDGLEVLKRVKNHYPDVQVIILTGHGSDVDRQEAERLGAFHYLEKPVNIDTLVTTIRDALAQKWDESMVASTFAEAGEFDSAEEYLKDK